MPIGNSSDAFDKTSTHTVAMPIATPRPMGGHIQVGIGTGVMLPSKGAYSNSDMPFLLTGL